MMLRKFCWSRALHVVVIATCMLAGVQDVFGAAPVTIVTGPNRLKHFEIAGQNYIPIGVNYLTPHLGGAYQSFGMFDNQVFNQSDIESNLKAIAKNGFTFVRLFLKGLDPDAGFGLPGEGLSDQYIDRIVTTLQIAQRYGLHVVLTGAFRQGVWLPKNYIPYDLPPESVVGGMNRLLLLPQMADAAGRFYHDLLVGIRTKDKATLAAIFYIDLYNELHFDLAQPPLSSRGGSFIFAGQDYDLANAMARQALMDRAAESWIHQVKYGVTTVDPHLLITASTFALSAFGHVRFDGGNPPKKVVRSSPYPLRVGPMIRGGVDLLDVHIYPSAAKRNPAPFRDRLAQLLYSNEITSSTASQIPLVAGEFGAMKGKFDNPQQSLSELEETEVAMCNLHFSGFAVWMWKGDGDTWNLDNPLLMQTLAPRYRPDFCGERIP
jgi:hypothetical protein